MGSLCRGHLSNEPPMSFSRISLMATLGLAISVASILISQSAHSRAESANRSQSTSNEVAPTKASPQSIAPSEAPQADSPGSAIIIVDLSKSFAPIDEAKEAALRGVTDVLQQVLTQAWPAGSVYVSAIGSSSLTLDAPCGPAITYEQQLLRVDPHKSASARITRSEVLKRWFTECVRRIHQRSAKEEPFTDISGAVAIATISTKTVAGSKLLCILSDFAEDLPKGNQRAEFVLKGERVLMLWGPQRSDEKDPNRLFNRLAQWEDRFRRAGASEVLSLPIAGFTSEKVKQWTQ